MQCPGGTRRSSPVATGLCSFLLRKSVIEVNAVTAVLMSLQGAALGTWDLRVLCPPADPIGQPAQSVGAGARRGEAEELRFIPCPALHCLAPLSQCKAAAPLPKQRFIPKHLHARAKPALIIASG